LDKVDYSYIFQVSPVPNPLVLAVERIRGITDLQSRRRCAEALAASLRFDTSGHEPTQVMNADDIETAFKVDKDEQDYYGIVLRRKKIRDFAHSYGKVLKSADITRLFKSEAYEAYFGKSIPKLAGKTKQSATVYTYAEILHRAGIGNVDLPDEVNQLFTGLNITFS